MTARHTHNHRATKQPALTSVSARRDALPTKAVRETRREDPLQGENMTRRRHQLHVVPNPIDVHVGGRLRLRRMLLGMTQDELGAKIGLSFQQVQKYERGANRIGASRLYELSRILDIPVSFFFDDMQPPLAAALAHAADSLVDARANRETLELMRDFNRIASRRTRDTVRRLIKEIAAGAGRDAEDGDEH
jgi:transcriptional regulator with XRE-family HTH domain